MEFSGDELAGVVDLFGALTRAELCEALAELAFKAGAEHDPTAYEDAVDAAVRTYHLVAVPGDETDLAVDDDASVLVAGPVAFAELPEGARDLPHILDASDREVDRAVAGAAAESRFRSDAARAVEAGDDDRIAELLDASYELEVWAPVDLASARERLDAALA